MDGTTARNARRAPYMGALPGLDQVYVATGHFRNGVLLAPVTGRLMAGLLLGDPLAAAELEPYSPERNRPAVSTGP
ncbi:hypothetical protein N6H14_33455 [Paenibacillus sp. CC-CFT747]|nr:hypothetical protein N6H14_33455 [Paenibacillus sp. CC-CFT747]